MLRERFEAAALNTVNVFGLIVLVFLVAFPFYWMIIASLKL